MSDVEPPWIAYPRIAPGEFFWREAGDAYYHDAWRPFWDSLGADGQRAYLERTAPPADWDEYLRNLKAFEDELERIDAEDIASGVLLPDGSDPNPPGRAPANTLLGKLHRLLGG
jgi:hypothetical protein